MNKCGIGGASFRVPGTISTILSRNRIQVHETGWIRDAP
jgi:hypothetical protein